MLTESNYLEENLAALKDISPNTIEKIRNADCSSYSLCFTNQNEINLLKKTEKGEFYFHSQEGALNEALEMVKNDDLTKYRVIFLYGIGLGYYYDAVKPWLKENSERYLVVLEDDLAAVRFFLESPKASVMLSDPQVIFKFTPQVVEEDWSEFNGELTWLSMACARVPCFNVVLKAYSDIKNIYPYKAFYQLSRLIRGWQERFTSDLETSVNEEVSNFYANLLHIQEAKAGNCLFDLFFRFPAIICGAGPSLTKQIPSLKRYEDKALIFAAGSAMNVLTQNGVTPHFGAVVGSSPSQKSRQMTSKAYEIPTFYFNTVNHEALHLIHGPRLLVDVDKESSSLLDEAFPLFFNQNIKVNHEKSSTYFCLDLTRHFGCEPAIFVGVDLAYTDHKTYAPGIEIHPMDKNGEQEKKNLEHVKIDLEVNDYMGKKVPTNWKWIKEGEKYQNYFKKFDYLIVNATEGGMGLVAIPNNFLKKIEQVYFTHSYDFLNLIHSTIQENTSLEPLKKEISKKLGKWAHKLKKCLYLCNTIIAEYTKLNESEVLYPAQESSLKRFEELSIRKYFEEVHLNERILSRITEALNLDLYPKLFLKNRLAPIEIAKCFYRVKIKTYLWLKVIIELHLSALNKAKKEYKIFQSQMNEEIANPKKYAKSQENIEETYSFQDNKIIIKDPELEISLKEPFFPEYVPESQKPIPKSLIQTVDHLVCKKDNVWEGQYLFFYPTGEVKGESFYLENELHGPSSFYTKEGQLLARSWFIRGKRQGKTRQYYASGAIYSIQRFKDGKRHGKQEYYYSDGILKSSVSYKNGELDGEALLFYPNGKPKLFCRD